MTITTVDQLETGLETRYSKINSTKADISGGNFAAGQFISYWLSTGGPGPGAGTIPTGLTTTALNHLNAGAIPFMQQGGSLNSYIGELSVSCSVPLTTVEIHDKLIQIGGLDGNVITLQPPTGNLTCQLDAFLASENIDERKGDANYSDVQWWAEFFVATGATATVATITVTYDDGTTGTLTTIAAFGRRLGRLLPLNSLIPAADSGKYIRGINTVQLSAATGTVGNFGFIATRYRTSMYVPTVNALYSEGWTKTGLPQIYNNSCLFPIVICGGSNSGTVNTIGKIVHG